MSSHETPQEALAASLAMAGGVRGLARSFLMLMATGFALFMPFAATYELYRVHEVARWQQVSARLDQVALEQSAFRKGVSTWRFHLTDRETGRRYDTGDVEPGDLPFSILGWSSMDGVARRYQAQTGETLRVHRSPDGSEIYLRPGDSRTMTLILALCTGFWAWVVVFRKRVSPLLRVAA
ncbi:MAG: hypothetical protein KGL44_04395 [Sphingomonadales bacterium]|nr:hypothetical protein [Sphingomonadales bacterium]